MAAPLLKNLAGLACSRCQVMNMAVLCRSLGTVGRAPVVSVRKRKKPDAYNYNKFTKRRWNNAHGLPSSGTEYGPLTEVPDWSYADGRPAPLAGKALKRQEENRDLAMRAMRLIKEMELAKETHRLMAEEEAQRRQTVLDNKLKAKS